MQRPQTIRLWEILFWVAIVIGLVNLFVFTPNIAHMSVPGEAPTDAAMAQKAVGWIEVVVAVVYVLLGLLFWHFIARKGNNVFKWIWVVLAILGILGSLSNLGMTFDFSMIGGILALIVLAIGVVNIVLLFMPASRPWFNKAARDAAGG